MNEISSLIRPDTVPGLIWAYQFMADGTAEKLSDPLDSAVLHQREGWLWLHFNLADAMARDWISNHAELPPRARELLLSTDEHLRLEIVQDTVVGVFADLQRNFDSSSEEMARLRFALTDHVVISARRSALHSVEEARRAIDEGRRLGTAVQLLEAIVEKFCDAAAHTADALGDKVDSIEDHIVDDKPRDERRALANIRRTAVRMHRQLIGLHAVFSRLERFTPEKIPEALSAAAHRLAQRLDTLHHDIHAITERARLLQDEIAAKSAAETNRLLYIISMLTAIFVPPTFVTGIFGMNTKGLLFTDNDNAFLYAMLMCAASAAAVYAVVKLSGLRR